MIHMPKFGCGAEGVQNPSESTLAKKCYNRYTLCINTLQCIWIKSGCAPTRHLQPAGHCGGYLTDRKAARKGEFSG